MRSLRTRLKAILVGATVLCTVGAGFAPRSAAQEAAPAQPPAAPARENAANPPPAEDFATVFEEWKTLLKEMRDLRTRFLVAPPAEAQPMVDQWSALVAKGHTVLPRLREAAIKAYEGAPETDRQITRFLIDLAKDYQAADQYELAMRTSKPLIDHKSESKEVYDIAGQAAFALDQFDAAEQYLKEAQAAGSISETGSQVLLDVGSYKALWEKEKALRDAESQKDDLPRVRIATTQGEIVVELFEDQAPDTVGNFVSLVEKGFYSGLNFHRVLPNFMAQVGCPVGDGSGGPGYEILDEFGREDARMHFRGTLSMAKTETPNSGGSQFFLTFRPTPHLNSRHTVFGRIISGIEVLEKIRRRDPTSPDAPEPDKLLEAVVVRKRAHEYLPKKTGG